MKVLPLEIFYAYGIWLKGIINMVAPLHKAIIVTMYNVGGLICPLVTSPNWCNLRIRNLDYDTVDFEAYSIT